MPPPTYITNEVGVQRNLLSFEDADPTGSFDNLAVFNLAIDSIPATGGTLYIPPGTYLISAPIVITRGNIRIVGDDLNLTTIKCARSTGNPAFNTVSTGQTVAAIFAIVGASNVTVQGITFDAQSNNRQCNGLIAVPTGTNGNGTRCTNINFLYNKVKLMPNVPSYAIWGQRTNDFVVVGNQIDCNQVQDALKNVTVQTPVSVTDVGTGTTVTVTTSGAHGLLYGQAFQLVSPITPSAYRNLTAGQSAWIVSNVVSGTVFQFVNTTSGNGAAANLTNALAGGVGDQQGIELFGCTRGLVEDNTVSNVGNIGILCQSISSVTADNECKSIRVVNNQIDHCQTGMGATGSAGSFGVSGMRDISYGNNNITDFYQHGIRFFCSNNWVPFEDIIVSNNTVRGPQIGASGHGTSPYNVNSVDSMSGISVDMQNPAVTGGLTALTFAGGVISGTVTANTGTVSTIIETTTAGTYVVTMSGAMSNQTLQPGQNVTLTGTTGARFDGTFPVVNLLTAASVASTVAFQIQTTAALASASAGTVTARYFEVGTEIALSGQTVAAGPNYIGTYTVATTPAANQFTVVTGQPITTSPATTLGAVTPLTQCRSFTVNANTFADMPLWGTRASIFAGFASGVVFSDNQVNNNAATAANSSLTTSKGVVINVCSRIDLNQNTIVGARANAVDVILSREVHGRGNKFMNWNGGGVGNPGVLFELGSQSALWYDNTFKLEKGSFVSAGAITNVDFNSGGVSSLFNADSTCYYIYADVTGSNRYMQEAASGTFNMFSNNQTYASTSAASITPDFNGYPTTLILDMTNLNTLTQAFTINNPLNSVRGSRLLVYLRQDGTGTRTVAWGTAYRTAAGIATASSWNTAFVPTNGAASTRATAEFLCADGGVFVSADAAAAAWF